MHKHNCSDIPIPHYVEFSSLRKRLHYKYYAFMHWLDIASAALHGNKYANTLETELLKKVFILVINS